MNYSIENIFVVFLPIFVLMFFRYFNQIRYSTIFLLFSYLYIFLGLIFDINLYQSNNLYNYIYFSILICFAICFFDNDIKIFPQNKILKSNIYKSIFLIGFAIFMLTSLIILNALAIGSDGNVEYERLNLVESNKIVFYGIIVIAPFFLSIIFHEIGMRAGLITIFFLIVLALQTGFRAPILGFVIVAGITIILRDSNKLFKYVIPFVISGMALVLIAINITLTRIGDSGDLALASQVLSDRLFLLNLRNIDNIIAWHDVNGFMYGKTVLMDLTPLFSRLFFFLNISRGETYAEFITEELNPFLYANFVITPTLYGIGYANLGFMGLIFHALFIIFLIRLINRYVRYLPLQAVFIYFLGIAATRGIFSTIVVFFVPILLIYLILRVFFTSKFK